MNIREDLSYLIEYADTVRCGECKQWGSDGGALMCCEVTDMITNADDFCSYGERRCCTRY